MTMVDESNSFEILKTIGSLAGLGSFVFLVFDRFLKGRPIVTLSVLQYRGGQSFMRVQIKNESEVGILIKRVHSPGGSIRIWDSDSLPSAERAIRGEHPRLVIDAGAAVYLPLVWHDKRPEAEDVYFPVVVIWRNLRNPWMPQWPVRLWSSRAQQDEILAATHHNSGGGQ